MAEIRITVYRAGDSWYGARWVNGEYDGCDALDVPDGADADEAMAEARTMPMAVDGPRDVQRVADILEDEDDHTPYALIAQCVPDAILRNADLTLGQDNPGILAYGANTLGENIEAAYDPEMMPASALDDSSIIASYTAATEDEYRSWLADRERRGLSTETVED